MQGVTFVIINGMHLANSLVKSIVTSLLRMHTFLPSFHLPLSLTVHDRSAVFNE